MKDYDINRFSIRSIKKDYKTQRNNRAKLDTGFHCNYKCEFCYYIDKLHLKKLKDVLIEYMVMVLRKLTCPGAKVQYIKIGLKY